MIRLLICSQPDKGNSKRERCMDMIGVGDVLALIPGRVSRRSTDLGIVLMMREAVWRRRSL
jgi:hypothetical protein